MIKSRIQTDGFSAAGGQKYNSIVHCVHTVWKTEGIGAFARGLIPTLIRCVFILSLTATSADDSLQFTVCEWRDIPWI